MSSFLRLPALTFLLGMSLLIMPGLVRADAAEEGIVLSDAWARTSVTTTGAAYLTIENNGDAADTLLEVRSDAAARVELHTMAMDGMVMKMRRLDTLPIEAGETVSLAPGGLHIMLIRLREPLSEGMSVPLTLVFEKAGSLEVSAPVRPVGYSAH